MRSIFWQTTRAAARLRRQGREPLDQRLAKLRALDIVFHEKLGTQGERVDRIVALARDLAPLVGADPDKARARRELAKADLSTEMVGEFPELQGLMGRHYAELQGEDADVAAAIEEHYKPQGPSDRVPTDPVSIAVALADKLDTLVGFWAIDEKPTGSKDPYALRRAALGRDQAGAGEWRAVVELFGKAHQRHLRQEKNTFRLFERLPNGSCYELETWKQSAGWSIVRSDGTTKLIQTSGHFHKIQRSCSTLLQHRSRNSCFWW